MQPESRRGFPWIPFLAILGLVTLGVVFILAEHSSKPSKSAHSKDSSLDDLTPSTGTDTNASNFPTVQTDTSSSSTNCSSGAVTSTTSSTPGIATTADGFLTTATTPDTGSNPGGPSPAQPAGASIVPTTTATPTTATTSSAPCTLTSSTVPTTTSSTIPTTPVATTPTTSTTPSTSSTSATGSGGTWPAGKHGYTVVLASFAKDRYARTDAEARSVEAQQKGVSSGVLDSDDFTLRSGLWVVFAGVFDTQTQADAHVSEVAAKGYQGAYVRKIDPS